MNGMNGTEDNAQSKHTKDRRERENNNPLTQPKKDASKVVKDWEKNAALSDSQNQAAMLVQNVVCDRPVPHKVKERLFVLK